MKLHTMFWQSALLIGAMGCLAASAQDKIVNGVAHSELYPGATLDVRVNACIEDAETGANGAVSHVCDSSGDGGTQTIAAQINVGDTASDPVTWVLPAAGTWNVTSSVGASNSAIYQYGFSHILGSSVTPNRLQITNTAASGGIYALYTNNSSSSFSGYYWAEGFALRSTSAATASGAVMLIPGGFDLTAISHVTVESYIPGITSIKIGGTGGLCCSASFDHVSAGGNGTGGSAVDIEGNGANESTGVWFYSTSFGRPGPGLPVVKCNDTSSDKQTSIGFFGLYEEGLGANQTVPINQISGCGSVVVHGNTIAVVQGGTSSVAGWSVSNTNKTSLDISGLDMHHGFALPATAVLNSATGNTVVTDAGGHLTHYASNADYADNVSAFGTVNANMGFTVGGNPLSFSNLAGTVPSSQLPTGSNSALGVLQCDGTTVTCASGVISAVPGNIPVSSIITPPADTRASMRSGVVAIPVGATSATVSATTVTAKSKILLTVDDTLTIPGVACNSTVAMLVGGLAVTAHAPGAGFTISNNGTAVTGNPLCVSYTIVN